MTKGLNPVELEELWARDGAVTLRHLIAVFPGVAYTTLMPTADRLDRKGLLERTRDGRAFAYRPRWTRDDLDLRLASSAMTHLLADESRAL